ncbi:MAG: hypothetical protein ACTHN0_14315, partial [Aquihabitans sp.]
MDFGRRRPPAGQRRTGPPGEEHWWDDDDQAFVERPFLAGRDLGRGWQAVPMPNNAERFDPHGDDEHSVLLRAERDRRVLTALDEGAAWRHRKERVLVVPRIEVFRDPDDRRHRAAWQEHGPACLDAVWRERWTERDVAPGWIEARWKDDADLDAAAPTDDEGRAAFGQVDWISVEDHTNTAASGTIDRYEHLTVWCGRGLVTATVRHDDALDLDTTTV